MMVLCKKNWKNWRETGSRGNGLKFVRENVSLKNYHLVFISGQAAASLNDKMEIEGTERPVHGTLAIIEKTI
ncbi:MAG: hypothetical protein AAB360_01860 [Patescibacteria group bacterium]